MFYIRIGFFKSEKEVFTNILFNQESSFYTLVEGILILYKISIQTRDCTIYVYTFFIIQYILMKLTTLTSFCVLNMQ